MRKKRISRRMLVRRVSELEEENGRLRGEDTGAGAGEGAPDDDAPAICGRGYPTRALPFTAKSLEEAKRIIISDTRYRHG